MNNKRTWTEKISDFVSGKGFYLVVLICVAAIALSGYYLIQGVRGGLDGTLDQPVSGSAAIQVTPTPAPAASPTVRPTARPTDPPAVSTPKITTPPATSAPTQAPPSTVPSMAPAPLVFTWPVKGTVIAGFSVETLAYNETMGDWRTHGGIDIAASLGTQVLACANGVVSAIYQDDLMGTVVEIEHGQDSLVSLYANLAAAPTVSVGDAVTTGAVIGSVGTTAASEYSREPHLHFAISKAGFPVDPTEYLPQR